MDGFGEPSRPDGRRGWVRVAVAALLALHFLLGLSAVRHQAPTFDEVAHIAAGYNAWLNHDFRFDPANGDFVKRWVTLPLLALRPHFPPVTDPEWRHAEFFVVGYRFLYQSGNDPDAIVLACRAMAALLGVALGAMVWLWSRTLFGVRGGFVSLAVFALSPEMLAYAPLATTDVGTSLAFLASTWFLWRVLREMTWANLLGGLASVALLATTKLSVLLLVPIAGVLATVAAASAAPWTWRLGRPRAIPRGVRRTLLIGGVLGAHAVAGWVAIWAVYDFRYAATPAPAADITFTPAPANASPATGLLAATLAVSRTHHLLPAGFLEGVEGLASVSHRRGSFYAGHWKQGGQRLFFPYAFAVKTAPALLVLLALGAVGGWRGRARPSMPVVELVPLLALAGVYAAATVAQELNIGFRHLLPLYPVLYILAGGAGVMLTSGLGSVAVLAAGAWLAADSFAVRPDYLAYFNAFAGGPKRGYERLADSSLDWGQGLPALGAWVKRELRPDERFYFSYFGTAEPAHYGIEGLRLPGFPDWRPRLVYGYAPGVYAISATMLQQLYSPDFGPWTPAYESEYRAALKRLGLTEDIATDEVKTMVALRALPPGSWEQPYARLEALRFGRLCAWLRSRRPDAMAGYSILIWRLDRAALHAALWSPVESWSR